MYDTLFYGASVLAIGAAMRNPGRTLILESSGLAGREFIDALRFDAFDAPICPPGQDLFEEMTERGAAAPGRLHTPAAAAFLLRKAQQAGVRILFYSALISQREASGEVDVEALCLHRRHTFRAGRFVRSDSHLPLLQSPETRLNALLWRSGGIKPLDCESFSIREAFYPDTAVLSLPVDPHGSFSEHRAKAFELMRTGHPQLSGAKLLSISSTLCVTTDPVHLQIGKRSAFIPSCGRKNLFDALDYGYALGGGDLA